MLESHQADDSALHAVGTGSPRLEPVEAQAHLADPTLVAYEVRPSSHEDRKVRNPVIKVVKIWREMRDVPVERHAALRRHAVDAALPGRPDADGLAAVTWAYASPALDAPAPLDSGAASALKGLNERGIAVRILKNEGLLNAFKFVGVVAQHAVRVGDDVRLDVEGARLANLRVIHLGGGRSCDDMPDASIQGLSELPAAADWREAALEPRDAEPTFLAGPAARR